MSYRALITGATGLLGQALLANLPAGYRLYATASRSPSDELLTGEDFLAFSLTEEDFSPLARFCKPDVVINCAAVTDHALCENNPALAQAINATAVERLTRLFPDAYFIQVSTDAVFGDDVVMPDESVPPVPFSVYGKTKLAGESFLLSALPSSSVVLRTTIVGLGGRRHTPSLAEWILRTLRSGTPLNLYTDAVFTPVSVWDFLPVITWCIDQRPTSVLHACGSQAVSKHDFGYLLARHCGLDTGLIRPAELARSAHGACRRMNQSLSSSKLHHLRGKALPNASDCAASIARRFQ